MAQWSDYQDEVARFFGELSLDAKTNVTLTGVRTKHDIDVVVSSKHAGFDVLWLVECKSWKTAIPKEKVLALRTIVDDVGADRGFIMAEKGYQAGALEASRATNVMLSSIVDLRETLAHELGMAKLSSLVTRIDACRERYWAIDKTDRIDVGLRTDVGVHGYMGDVVIKAVEQTLRQAVLRGFPVRYDRLTSALSAYGDGCTPVTTGSKGAIETPSGLFETLNLEVCELEDRLDIGERVIRAKQQSASKRVDIWVCPEFG